MMGACAPRTSRTWAPARSLGLRPSPPRGTALAAEPAAEPLAELDDVVVTELVGADRVDEAVALLDGAEAHAGVPLVDEAERVRLEEAQQRGERAPTWRSALADRDGHPVGYLGLVLGGPGAPATGDVTPDRTARGPDVVLRALLAATTAWVGGHATGRAQVWLRDARDAELALAREEGFTVDRRLGILARPLDDVPEPPAPEGASIGTFSDADADAVVDVLAAAYAGTDDGGWTREDFDARRGLDWFDPADLLVARDDADGRVLGLHWTKRRGARVGEVHNLAVHPDAQGRRLGGALLVAGLAHLRAVGCHEVMLWVDLANDRAVRLYTAHGFATAWTDVALGLEPDGS